MNDTPTDWNMEWDATNDCYSLTRINNGGVEQIDLFVDEPTAKAAQTALNSHGNLVAACKMWIAETKWLDADVETEAAAMADLVSLCVSHGMDPLDPASVFIHTFTEAAIAKAGVA